MISFWVTLRLKCDYPDCKETGQFLGSTPGHATQSARESGWSVNGPQCRCPAHKGRKT